VARLNVFVLFWLLSVPPLLARANENFCTLMYTVSPYMSMSTQGLGEIQKFALDHHWNLKVILDPQAFGFNDGKGTEFYPLDGEELESFLQHGFFNHFPAYFIQHSNREIIPLRFGYIFANQLQSLIELSEDSKECVSGVQDARFSN